MAKNPDPDIDTLIARFPNVWKPFDFSHKPKFRPSQKFSSSAQEPAAQAKTSQEPETAGKRRKIVNAAGEVGVEQVVIGSRPSCSDGMPPAYSIKHGFEHGSDTDTGAAAAEEGKAEPGRSTLMKLAERYENSPDKKNEQTLSDSSFCSPTPFNTPPAQYSTSPPLSDALAQGATLLSNQKQGASSLRNETHEDNERTLSDLPRGDSSPSEKLPTEHSLSPPLSGVLARRDSILKYEKPGTSPIRNEIHSAPADHDVSVHKNSEGSLSNTNPQNEPFVLRGRPYRRTKNAWKGTWANATKVDTPAAGVRLFRKAKSHKEGATEQKTATAESGGTGQTQAAPGEGAVGDRDSLVPPITAKKNADGGTEYNITSRDGQPLELMFRKEGVGLTKVECMNTPDEFVEYITDDPGTLSTFWDMAYDPRVRRKVLEYKRDSAFAGKTDMELDWRNRLLIALVNIQEAKRREGAKHVVNESERETSENGLGTAAVPEESAELADTDILIDALNKVRKFLNDENYDIYTALTSFALSKGVKPDTTLVKKIIYLYIRLKGDLIAPPSGFEAATTQPRRYKIFLEKLVSLDLEIFGKSKKEESNLAMEDPTTGKAKGREGSNISRGRGGEDGTSKREGKKGKSPVNDAVTGKGKRKERDALEEDSTIGDGDKKQSKPLTDGSKKGKGKRKWIKFPLNDAATGRGMGKEPNMLIKGGGLAAENGKSKGNDPPTEGLAMVQGKANVSDVSGEDPAIGKSLGKEKESELLVEDLAIGNGNFKDNDAPTTDAAMDKGKGEASDVRAKNPVIGRGKGKEIKLFRAAPVPMRQYPTLPPGLMPATPAITTRTYKQQRNGRPLIDRHGPIALDLPTEKTLKLLEENSAAVMAQIRAGATSGPLFDELEVIGRARNFVTERDRLGKAGGKIADRLAQRLKKMAEEDGAPMILYCDT